MNLAFQRRGLNFFFITLVLEVRPTVLSELIDAKHRPRLTALGEVVKSVFAVVHKV